MASFAMTTTLALHQPHSPTTTVAAGGVTISPSRLVAFPRLSHRKWSLVVRASPLDDKVEQSIKIAEETCKENPTSAECAVAWDDVEELSAAASHQRVTKAQDKDPLENFCKDNPETDECRVYDN